MDHREATPRPGVRGWLGPAQSCAEHDRLRALGESPGVGDLREGDAGLGAFHLGRGGIHRVGRLLVAWSGTPRLDGADRNGDDAALAGIIAERFEEAPERLPACLGGDFVLAVLDPRSRRALLAVDRLGIRDVAWAVRDRTLVFSPAADRVAADPAIRAGLDRQAIYDYLFHHVVTRPHTVFEGVARLRPGEALLFEDGCSRTLEYWRPSFTENDRTPEAELEAEFRDTIRAAVARAAADGRTGAFLSGGTDSSTITGLLGEVTGARPRTYSIGFDAPGYDETGYARLAARHFGADHHEYYVTPGDVAAAIPRVAAAFDQPFGNASVVPAYYCSKLAADDGVDTLLGGDGGDELFAGNSRYSKQWLFSLYARVPAPLRAGLIEPISSLRGARHIPPLRKLARYVEQARMPVPRRLLSWNLLNTIGPERVFTPEFLGAVDREAPLEAVAEEYERTAAYAPLNRLLAVDMKFTLGDDDLRKVTTAAAMAGVGTRFPFLDDDVVELAARVPPGLKLRRGRLRHFFKEALQAYLPREILEKEKHGFGLPFGEWLRCDPELQAVARDSLDGLRSRGIVREAMIDELTGTRLDQHAGYFGTLTWVLIMLEQWFRHHGSSAGT